MTKRLIMVATCCVAFLSLCGAGATQTRQVGSDATDSTSALEIAPPVHAQPADTGLAATDTSAVFPPKMKTTAGWERLVSLPGTILYIPFWLVFQATDVAISLTTSYPSDSWLAQLIAAPDGSHGIVPVYSSRSGFGLKYFQKNVPNEGARIDVSGAVGLMGRCLGQVRIRKFDAFGGKLTYGGQITYRNMPDEKFYGIGPKSLESDLTNYHLTSLVGEFGVGKWLTPKLVLGVIGGADYYKPGPGRSDDSPSTTDEYPPGTLPGLYEEIAVTRLMLGFNYAGENRPVRPSAGWNIEGRARVSGQINGATFEYVTSFLDVIKYVELWRNRILFLRFGFRLSDGLEARQIPFYQASELGSDETIRGFQRGRFRDLDLILGTIEYRYPIWRKIDALFFVDAGQVQQDVFRDFVWDDLAVSYGGGFRVWSSDDTFMRLEVGFSEEGYRFLLLLNPSSERRTFAYF